MKCVICNKDNSEILLRLSCGNLDGSTLYDPVTVAHCKQCGHVFNELDSSDQKGLLHYYVNEYSMNNLHSPNTKGDLPGSSNENSSIRYSNLFDFIKYCIEVDSQILDVGCATGGFLNSLDHRGYSGLYGIDISDPYLRVAKNNKRLKINQGSAEDIPHMNDKFDMVIADQVVEHVFDPNKIFIEAKRVLKTGGYFCIGVPDAMKYDDCFFFDFYWFLMREHIHHFDLDHMAILARHHGFELMSNVTTFSNMISNKSVLPNLTMMFRLNDKRTICPPVIQKSFNLRYKIKDYIRHSQKELAKKNKIINIIYDSQVPLVIFGVSRELFYLYENTSLRDCNINGFIDDTPYKQEFFTFDGQEINSRDMLKNSSECVLVTATAHTEKIKSILYGVGFKGKTIEI